jgi:hypothetical protein
MPNQSDATETNVQLTMQDGSAHDSTREEEIVMESVNSTSSNREAGTPESARTGNEGRGEHMEMPVENAKRVVQLIGTEEYGVEERAHAWTTVTYTMKEPQPSAHGDLCEAVENLREELTGQICQLTGMLSRLRDMQLRALDGDQEAIDEALVILDERPFIADDIWELESDVDALVELVEERSEHRHVDDVKAEEVEIKVRDLALPFIKAGEYVVVRTSHANLGVNHKVTGANIVVDRRGHYVTITVKRNIAYAGNNSSNVVPLGRAPEGTTLESAYAALVEEKGEAVAKMINMAVEAIAQGDTAKQVDLLWKQVSA